MYNSPSPENLGNGAGESEPNLENGDEGEDNLENVVGKEDNLVHGGRGGGGSNINLLTNLAPASHHLANGGGGSVGF